MKKFCGVTFSSMVFLITSNTFAARLDKRFNCTVDNHPTYRSLVLNIVKIGPHGEEKISGINVELKGQTSRKVIVRNGQIEVDPNSPAAFDGMTLSAPDSAYEAHKPKPQDAGNPENISGTQRKQEANRSGGGWFSSLLGGGSKSDESGRALEPRPMAAPAPSYTTATPTRPYPLDLARPSSASVSASTYYQQQAPQGATSSYLTITVPPPPAFVEKTIVTDMIETLVYDHDFELVAQQYNRAEAEALNDEIREINEEKKRNRTQLMEEVFQTSFVGPRPLELPPLQLEPLVQVPGEVPPLRFSHDDFPTVRGAKPSRLTIQLDNSVFAKMECKQTPNLENNFSKSTVGDVKGLYGKKAADPRAAEMNNMRIGNINAKTFEMYCLSKVMLGKIDLTFFDRGELNVSCEYDREVRIEN